LLVKLVKDELAELTIDEKAFLILEAIELKLLPIEFALLPILDMLAVIFDADELKADAVELAEFDTLFSPVVALDAAELTLDNVVDIDEIPLVRLDALDPAAIVLAAKTVIAAAKVVKIAPVPLSAVAVALNDVKLATTDGIVDAAVVTPVMLLAKSSKPCASAWICVPVSPSPKAAAEIAPTPVATAAKLAAMSKRFRFVILVTPSASVSNPLPAFRHASPILSITSATPDRILFTADPKDSITPPAESKISEMESPRAVTNPLNESMIGDT
jgi:hypothetical protein